jgi:hypothetical protein
MGGRGRSGAGDGRWRREEFTPLKEGGGDKLLRWTVGGVRIGESSCLGTCMRSRSSDEEAAPALASAPRCRALRALL